MDIALRTDTGDLDIRVSGLVPLVTGASATRQRITIGLRWFLAEWFLDPDQGLPYYRDVLVRGPDLELVRTLLRREIARDAEVQSVDSIEVSLEPTRVLSCSFSATLIDGSILEEDDILLSVLTLDGVPLTFGGESLTLGG